MSERDTDAQVTEAQQAALRLANVSEAERNAALQSIADAIRDSSEAILDANATDVEEGERMLA
ncbi:MAG: hypothetical protein V5A27_06965 [Halapricum sp.]